MKTTLKRITRRLRYWFRQDHRQQALNQEMQFHLDALASDLETQGLSPEDASSAARKRFGNVTQTSEEARATWVARWLSDVAQDLRYTFRGLRRDAGFTTFALLIVGLGIGASATIFSVVNALLLRPLPFHQPERLAWIANGGSQGLSGQTVQVGPFLDLRSRIQSFSDVAAYFAFYGVGDNKLVGIGEPERLSGVPVSENFFSLLGVDPQIGRHFTSEECQWNGPRAVMLSDSLWKRRFASDPAVIGRTLILDDDPVAVVGVLPASFDFAAVFAPGSRIDLFSPFPLTAETDRWGNTLSLIGRLKPEATTASAQAEARVLAEQINRQRPDRNSLTPQVTLLSEHVSGRLRPALFVLACAVAAVMLIVCANLSNLQLARTATRRKEIAIRAALGAGRHRLLRQMLTESVVLSFCGAALGLVLAIIGTRLLSSLESISIPMLGSVRIDAGALGFTSLAAILSGLLFGLVPALQVRSAAVHDSLKESARGSSESKRSSWVRGALVVSEVAFACVLLVGAGLLIRSFLRVLDVDLGFQPERAAALRIDPSSQYSDQSKRNAYFNEAIRRVRAIPAVSAAGLTDALPLGRNRSWGFSVPGRQFPPGENPNAFVRVVSDGYFHAMGIPLRAGRDFSERDLPSSEPALIVNETLARKLWPDQNPIGQIATISRTNRRVVGVVSDVRHLALESEAGSEMYLPIRQTGDFASVDLVVRTALPFPELASSIRDALKPIEPNLPANQLRTLQQLVDNAVSPRRFVVWLLAGFAGFALILASLGIYAVISYSVNQRTQEIGIRMALGASAGRLQSAILLRTLGLAATGMLFGVAASWVLSRTISGMLYGVTATDPTTFVGILALLSLVAALAGYLPARRASRIDPIAALRAE